MMLRAVAREVEHSAGAWAIKPAPAPVQATAQATAPQLLPGTSPAEVRAAAIAAGIIGPDPEPAYPAWVDTSAFLQPGWETIGQDSRPDWMMPAALVQTIAAELPAAGFTGPAVGWTRDAVPVVSSELASWMQATGNTLQADAHSAPDTITVRVRDSEGGTIAQAQQSTADGIFGALVGLGVAAVGAVAAIGPGFMAAAPADAVGAVASAGAGSIAPEAAASIAEAVAGWGTIPEALAVPASVSDAIAAALVPVAQAAPVLAAVPTINASAEAAAAIEATAASWGAVPEALAVPASVSDAIAAALLPVAPVAPATFSPAADSQAASAALGITGAEAAAAAQVPAWALPASSALPAVVGQVADKVAGIVTNQAAGAIAAAVGDALGLGPADTVRPVGSAGTVPATVNATGGASPLVLLLVIGAGIALAAG